MSRQLVLLLSILLLLPSLARPDVTLVKDPWPGPGGWSDPPRSLIVVNGVLFFVAYNSESGVELWKSDGTPDGTALLKDTYPGPLDGFPRYLTSSGGKLFFVATDGPSYDYELWVSDGTEAGTVKLDINPAGASSPDGLTDVNGVLYCAATHPTWGRELWKSDGTMGGTVMVTDLNFFPTDAGSDPTDLKAAGNRLYFAASTFYSSGKRAGVSDGTQAGTILLGGGLSPHEFTAANPPGGTRVFFVCDGELYATNGTSAGTALVKQVNPSGNSGARDLGALGSILLFSANDGINGNELWRSDGTAAGTYLVKDLNTQPVAYPYVGYSWPRGFTTLADVSLFSAYEPGTGRELWITDGTTGGTAVASDIIPGASGWVEPRFSMFQNEIYFDFEDGVHGSELWKTDGTASGTVLVADVRPGPPPSVPQELTAMGNALYFGAYGDETGGALWKYESGVTAVPDRAPRPDLLLQNTPNPFNPQTRIAFELGQRGHAALTVYDVQGKLIRTLVDGTLPSGRHERIWDGRDNEGNHVASGVYFMQLRTAGATLVRKATLLK